MMDLLTLSTWSPYVIGAAIGILSWFSFMFSRKALGTSTSYARTAGMLEKKFLKVDISQKPYYEKIVSRIDWQWMLVVGIFIGSFISAVLSGEFSISFLPETEFSSILNTTYTGRIFSSLVGGVFLGFGSRFAGGCTSGHGISGTLQLAISSWLAAVSFFIGGVITALLIF